jgi:hypothetical protein
VVDIPAGWLLTWLAGTGTRAWRIDAGIDAAWRIWDTQRHKGGIGHYDRTQDRRKD